MGASKAKRQGEPPENFGSLLLAAKGKGEPIRASGRAGGMFGSAGGGGIPTAVGTITKDRTMPTFHGDSFNRRDQEGNEKRPQRRSSFTQVPYEKQIGKEVPEGNKVDQYRTENLGSVKDKLLSTAKERRDKVQKVKQMATAESGIDQFGIKNYRAGGSKTDRGEKNSENDKAAGFFLGKDYKRDVTKTISELPGPLQSFTRDA